MLLKAQNVSEFKMNLSNFEVIRSVDKVNINWKINDRSSSNYFEVEKSNDGKNFKTVAYVLGPDPRKTNNDFGCFDKINSASKRLYYRLKKVDANGTFEFSEIKMIAINK